MLILFCALAALFFFLFCKTERAPGRKETVPSSHQVVALHSEGKFNSPSIDTIPTTSVPARMSLDDLERQSSRGDAKAACHVAAIYEQCLMLLRQYDDILAMIETKNQGASGYFEALRLRSDYCAGISINTNDAIDKWKDAAQKGSTNGMRGYVSGSSLLGISDATKYRDALREYSRSAEGFAWKLADRGDINAIIALAHAYNNGPTPAGSKLSQVVEKDQVKALAIFYYLQNSSSHMTTHSASENRVMELASRSIKKLESSLSATSIRDSAIMAGTLTKRWTAPLNYEKIFMSTLEDGTLSSAQAEDCQDEDNRN
ncbi:hypothetical protein [Xanthomonas phaseoli]|uniref:hypothetical protein n=2 Tax=Xanthomonas TaxID=338 RepID=UPI001F0A3E88|nr:hypothetical protein [Xanthomonas phaseoli]